MEDAAAARDHPESRPADPQTGATSFGIRPRVLSAIRYLTAHNTHALTAVAPPSTATRLAVLFVLSRADHPARTVLALGAEGTLQPAAPSDSERQHALEQLRVAILAPRAQRLHVRVASGVLGPRRTQQRASGGHGEA